jgi:hypothetical protein
MEPAIGEHVRDIRQIMDVGRGIAAHDQEVGFLAPRNAADAVVDTEKLRALEGSDANGVQRRETGLDEKLDRLVRRESRYTETRPRSDPSTRRPPAFTNRNENGPSPRGGAGGVPGVPTRARILR